MDLRKYVNSLPGEEARKDFARRCGTSIGHIRNVMYGLKPCSAELAAAIEIESSAAVTRKELLPDRWHRIWPELVDAAGVSPGAVAAGVLSNAP